MLVLSTFFFSSYAPHPYLPSFPTRRSSDLVYHAQLLRSHRFASAVCHGTRPPVLSSSRWNQLALPHTCGCYRKKDRKSTRLNSSHRCISYAVFCLKKKNKKNIYTYHFLAMK